MNCQQQASICWTTRYVMAESQEHNSVGDDRKLTAHFSSASRMYCIVLYAHWSSNDAICRGVFAVNCEMNGALTQLSTESEHVTLPHIDDRALILIILFFIAVCEHTRWIYRLQENKHLDSRRLPQ